MRKRYQIPNLGERDLNQITSWSNISRGTTGIINAGKRFVQEAHEVGAIHAQNQVASAQRGYASFTSALMGARGHVGGMFGANINSAINTTLQKIKSLGGIQIKSADLGKAISGLEKRLESISRNVSGDEKAFLDDLRRTLQGAKGKAEAGGFAAMGATSRDILKATFGVGSTNDAKSAIGNLVGEFKTAAGAVRDVRFARAISAIKTEMENAAAAAKDASGKLRAAGDAKKKLDSLAGFATGADKTAIENLSKTTAQTYDTLRKSLGEKGAALRGNLWSSRFSAFTNSIGQAARYLAPLKRTFDVGNAIFQQVNSKFNQIARTQMGITSERGAYGRQIRGAGINFQDMMVSIGAGRKAGMEDRQVVSQMVSLQENLARARWGEGPLIENMGKWGLSPYDANGNVKEGKEIMIDYSRKLNSITDKAEKLQFLLMQGFRPEQMEYVANYEEEAKRWEQIKRNPHLQGVLESAQIFDESGMSAKIDAATKIELKRRQILNQNAWDEGIMSGMMRSLHPENWLLNDWTARQAGIKQGKSDMAMENLTKAMRELRDSSKQNKASLDKNSLAVNGLSTEDLENLSFTSGWAEQDIKNFGNNSQVWELSKAFSRQLGGYNPQAVDKSNREKTALIGGISGAVIGALGMALAPVTGGISMLLAGAAGAGIGAAFGYNNPLNLTGNGREALISQLRNARTQEEVDQLTKGTAISGLSLADTKSEQFKSDEGADKILQGKFVAREVAETQNLVTNGKIVKPTDTYVNKYTKAIERSGRSLTDYGRWLHRAYNLDKNVKLDNKAYQRYVEAGPDYTDRETAGKHGRFYREIANEHRNWTTQQVDQAARKKVEEDFYGSLTSEEKKGYMAGLIEDRAKKGVQYQGEIKQDLAKKRNRLKELEEEFNGVSEEELLKIKTAETDANKISSGDVWSWEGMKQSFSGGDNDSWFGAFFEQPENRMARARWDRAKKARELSDLRKEIGGKTDAQVLNEKLQGSDFAGMSQEERERAIIKELYGAGGKFEGQKRKFDEMFGWEKKERYAEIANAAGTGGTAEQRLGRMAAIGLSKGFTKNDIANFSLTEAEVDAIEKKQANGEPLTEDEKNRYDIWKQGSDAKARAQKQKREEKKKKKETEIKQTVANATDEEIRGAFKDASDAEMLLSLRQKEASGAQLDADEKAAKESLEKTAARNIKRKKDQAALDKAAEEVKDETSEEEKAALDSVIAEGKQAEAAAVAEKGKRPLAEMSDINRMYDLQKRGGFTDEMLARHFGADRLAQYKDAMEKGEIGQLDSSGDAAAAAREEYRKKLEKKYAKARVFGDDEQNEEWKKATIDQAMEAYDLKQRHKADAEAALDAYAPNRKKKASLSVDYGNRILPGFGKGKSDEATEAMQESAAQATTAMKDAVEKGETAAATGNIAATGGAAGGAAGTTEKNVNNDVKQSIVLNINGEFPVNEEGVKAGAKAGMMEYGSSLAQLLSSKAFTSIA